MIFASREKAGQLLADALKEYKKKAVVIAIPRGGVVVGAEIAKALGSSLDIIITRKLGAPDNPELAIGATTSKGGILIDRDLVDRLGISQDYVHQEHLRQLAEARRREKVYLKGERPDLTGKVAILVDDGLATGATMEVAIRAASEALPEKIIVAVPVAPTETVEDLKRVVAEVIVLHTPSPFHAIGEFYSSFPQISDDEVVRILNEANS